MKRKVNLKKALKNIDKVGERLSGVKLSKDPKRAELELELLGVATRCKKEGITSA